MYVTHSLVSTQNILEGTDIIGGQLRGDKECPFSGVTSSGRFFGGRKVWESNAQSVEINKVLKKRKKYKVCPEDNISIPSLVSMVTGQKQKELVEIKSAPSVVQPILAEFGGRCQKAMLRVWGLTKY